MRRAVTAATALAMMACTVVVGVSVTTGAYAAEQARKITTRAVAEPLKKAQEAMAKRQWDTALAEIAKAQAVDKKTPFEAYQIDEFLGYVLTQQKQFGKAAPVFERMLNSGMDPPEKADERIKTVAKLYFEQKDYRKAADWSKRWVDKHPNELEMSTLLAQSYYLLQDYKNAAATMNRVVSNAERAGQTPKEAWLQIVMSSHFKLENKDGIAQALKKLVRYYPKTEYWENLLDIYRRKANGDALILGYYRLMNEVGTLEEKSDYVEMAQLAMDAGVPGEAQQIVEKGVQNGTLKGADKTEQSRYDRLLAGAKKQVATDRPTLTQLAKEAERATQGQPDVGLGQAYLSYGMIDESIAALQRGLKKGNVADVDAAQISLGMAYLRKGQKEQARAAFRAVKDGSKWKELAELWEVRAQAPA
jgi:tetratricopeptide (TPR) repeat protein